MTQKNLFIFAALAASLLYAAVPAWADAGRMSLTEENDTVFPPDDRHFTQGLRLGYLSGTVTPGGNWDKPYEWLGDVLPIFENDGTVKRKYDATILGQSIFTPIEIGLTNPPTSDRPYAGWLYTGAGLLQETALPDHHRLENVELLVGVVGPAAMASEVQNDWHQLLSARTANGWDHQLQNEPGFILSYERKWRFQKPLGSGLVVDAIPELGASGGNVLTYAQAGTLFRFGQNLGADYGPYRIRPSISGTSWFDKEQLDGGFGWYFFVGTQGRAVGHNIFLDGNSFASSRSVSKNPFVADFVGGVSLFWADDAKLDLTFTERTKEFDTQTSHNDRFGSITASFGF